jgi:PhnB protein
MPAINTYLNFNGNCEEAMNFYKSVFGGEFLMMSKFSDAPSETELPKDKDGVLHAALPIGSNILMASDCPPGVHVTHGSGGYFISINADSKGQADAYFNGLSAGGTIKMSMGDTFWGAYFGMLTDKFGIDWMISFDSNSK